MSAPVCTFTRLGSPSEAGRNIDWYRLLVRSTSMTFAFEAGLAGNVSGDHPCITPRGRTWYPAPFAQLQTATTSSADDGAQVSTAGDWICWSQLENGRTKSGMESGNPASVGRPLGEPRLSNATVQSNR